MNITEAVLKLGFQYPDLSQGVCPLGGEPLLLLCIRENSDHQRGDLVSGCTGYLPEFFEKICTKQEFLDECERIGKAIVGGFTKVGYVTASSDYTIKADRDGCASGFDFPGEKPWPQVGDVVKFPYRGGRCRAKVIAFDDDRAILSLKGFSRPLGAPESVIYHDCLTAKLRPDNTPSEPEVDEATIREAIEIIRPFAGNGSKIQELARHGYLKRPEQKG